MASFDPPPPPPPQPHVRTVSPVDESISNPLFLHHGDNPGTVPVSQFLNSENYSPGSHSISKALSEKNKTGFIDGTIVKPDPSNSKYDAWIRCNDMVLSWLLNSLSKDLAGSVTVIYIDTARDMWLDRLIC